MERQEELFGEFKNAGSKNIFLKRPVFPEKTFTFTFSHEKFILLILGFIILSAAMFAFGFEQGKKRSAVRKRVVLTPSAVQKPYTIQTATFKSKELAQRETETLRKKGFSTTIIGINGLYQVWAGEYANPQEASGALSVLKKTYKDCYIRKR